MKLLKILTLVLLSGSAFIACQKDHDKPSTEPPAVLGIEGTYKGTYSSADTLTSTPFILNIKPGGVFEEIEIQSGLPTGQGTWQLQGTKFTANYKILLAPSNGTKFTANYKMLISPFNEFSIALTYDVAAKKLKGSWGFDKSAIDGGSMEVHYAR